MFSVCQSLFLSIDAMMHCIIFDKFDDLQMIRLEKQS